MSDDPQSGTLVTMQQAVASLRERGVTTSFEQVLVEREWLAREAGGSVSHGLTTFPMPQAAGSIEELLDALVQIDSEYRWEAGEAESVFTVYPRDGGALEWPVPAQDWSGVPWIEAIQSIGLEDHGITLFPRGLERRADVTLEGRFDELPARRWLTTLLERLGSGHYWNLAGIEQDRSLVIGQIAPTDGAG